MLCRDSCYIHLGGEQYEWAKLSSKLPLEGEFEITLQLITKSEIFRDVFGIAWTPFKELHHDSTLGGAQNPNSLGLDFSTGSLIRNFNSSRYGPPLSAGDVVTAVVNMNEHTLRYKVNGEDMGVAFDRVPSQGVYFCLSMAMRHSSVEILEMRC